MKLAMELWHIIEYINKLEFGDRSDYGCSISLLMNTLISLFNTAKLKTNLILIHALLLVNRYCFPTS